MSCRIFPLFFLLFTPINITIFLQERSTESGGTLKWTHPKVASTHNKMITSPCYCREEETRGKYGREMKTGELPLSACWAIEKAPRPPPLIQGKSLDIISFVSLSKLPILFYFRFTSRRFFSPLLVQMVHVFLVALLNYSKYFSLDLIYNTFPYPDFDSRCTNGITKQLSTRLWKLPFQHVGLYNKWQHKNSFS